MSLLRRVIGGVLRRIRTRQGRTLREVAEAAGVSLPYLSEVERGRKEASSEVLAAICRALGIRLSDLLEEARDDLRRVEPRTPVGPRAAVAAHAVALPLPRYGDRLARLEQHGDRLTGTRRGPTCTGRCPGHRSPLVRVPPGWCTAGGPRWACGGR